MKKQILAASAALAGLTTAAIILLNKKDKPLNTVIYVDPEKYTGKWYEIAAFPQWFEKGCSSSMANYILKKDGSIKVINSCIKNGEPKISKGKALIADQKTNAKLDVQFFWPFKGKYWIIALASDYSYAMVGHPNRKYLWILSRKPKLESHIYNSLLSQAAGNGFDVRRLAKTPQD